MRRRRWLSFIIFSSCLVLAQSSTAAETSSSQRPTGALILYDSASPYPWLGELHAIQIANLLGHFPLESTIAPVESYLSGDVEDYAVTFYLGDAFDNLLPYAFLSDVMTTERTVCWFNYNLWQLAWDEYGYWDPEFTSRYGFQFAGIDASGFPEIVYKGVSLLKDVSNPDLGATLVFDPDRAEVKAVAYRPATGPHPEDSWPYVVHAGNLWYFADTPFSYVSEEDRYLVFCDLLHDIVGIDHAPSRRGLIRIEDVDPTCDPRDLIDVADYLQSEGVPFEVAVIPVFRDPLGANTGGLPAELRLSDSPEVVSALHYMIEHGGQLVLHGYTHQYDAVPNPYNGMTGDDCEFFRTIWDEETGETQFLGPVPEDSVAWVNGRIDDALAEMALCGLPVVAWETPHYLASALDSVEFGSRFSLVAGRVIYFSSLGPYFAGQFYPYLIETDIYGQRLLPENLGNVARARFYDYPPRLPDDIIRAAEKNLVVRDAWASSYFHPYLHIKYLREVIEGTEALGYTYCSIPPLLAKAGPDKVILPGGSATLEGSASDGEPPYSYSWSPAAGLDDATAAWPTASPESTTVYTLTVTDDIGQTAADLVTVTVAPPVVAEAGPDRVIVSGGSAALEGAASDGWPPYTYSWSPAAGLDDATAAEPIASPDSTTTYTLTVTDDLGQTDTESVTVTVAAAVVAKAGPDRLIASGGATMLEGSASDGMPPYTYSWSPAAGLDDATAAEPTASPESTTTYTLTVTDDLGQTDTDTVTVTVATPVVAEAGRDSVIVAGGATTLEGSASGGVPPYEYSWSPAAGLDDETVAKPTASPESTTTYTLTVTDDLGQTDWDTVTVTVATAVVAEAGPDKVIAADGSTTLEGSASGGVPPHEYSWSPAAGLDDETAAEPTASPASTRTYTLTVTDGLGQTDADTVTVTVASAAVAEAGPDRLIASGGSSTLAGSASGGLPPYQYSWSPTAGLDDATAAQPTASPADTTTYTLTVTDDLGQTDWDTVTVTVASAVAAEAGPERMIVSGGSTTLEGSASGGVPPYDYSWSPAAGLDDETVADPTASPESTTVYTLTVTDDLGQTDGDAVTVTVVTAPPVVAEAGPDRLIASGGSTTLAGSASGGVPPYAYSWSPAAGLDDATVAEPTASPEGTTVYTLTVTDDIGLTGTDTVTVTVASAVAAEAGPDRVIASGGSTTLAGSASGGVSPYSYAWSPAAGLDDATAGEPTASPENTTTYRLTVTDDLGQTDTDTITVTVAGAVVAEAGPDRVIAVGGAATLAGSASGGVPPYTYSWSPATRLDDATAASPAASPANTTTYTLTVTDNLGQTGTDTVTVSMVSEVFADVAEDHWAGDEIAACVNAGIVRGYDDGEYHGSWPVTRDQMAVYISRALAGGDENVPDFTDTPTFPDVPEGFWALDYVEYAVSQNVVAGYDDGTYHPEYEVTRGQMAVYVARSLLAPTGEAALVDYVPADPRNFPDVSSDFWAYTHIEYCVENGVVQGYEDGYYHPEYVVTRDQMAVYVARAFGLGL
jgi:uncharacterized protein YdaL/oxalate decarboxylase/phosphoglucose isomerase-like protein (cupin superfamily)